MQTPSSPTLPPMIHLGITAVQQNCQNTRVHIAGYTVKRVLSSASDVRNGSVMLGSEAIRRMAGIMDSREVVDMWVAVRVIL